jgi:hypothetical protein
MGSVLGMRYNVGMGWLRNLIFGEPDDDSDYLARLNNDANMMQPRDDEEGGRPNVSSDNSTKPDQYHSANGQKVIPEIEVERIESHPSGDNKYLEIWAHIRNHASFDIELDKYELLGQRGDLNKFLKPGEIFELRMYRGAMPQNDIIRRMYIQYKIVGTGDYFQADHMIEYKYEQDSHGNKWCMPEELKLLRPVRDI